MDGGKISSEKSHLQEHYRVKVSHKKPCKEYKSCNTEFDHCIKDFYIISAITYLGVLFSFAKDTSPMATQNGCASFSTEVYYSVPSFPLGCH